MHFFYYESTFIKTGDSETKEGPRVEEATVESLGGALLWLSRNVRGKKSAMLGCVDSLRSKSYSDRSEPRQGSC